MRPKVIGITGGIGSGKSVIARCLKVMGYCVYDADRFASEALDSNIEVKTAVIRLLGTEAYETGGKANRSFIANKVFNDPKLLAGLNDILHPIVKIDFDAWVVSHSNQRILFKEAAILFESGAYRQVDEVIAVTAPAHLRMTRVQKRDQRTEQAIGAIMARQMDQKELVRRSNHEIVNDERTPVLPALVKLLERLQA